MIRSTFLIIFFFWTLHTLGQGNAFKDYAEFQANKPSLTFNFELKRRTTGDVFMKGGIQNYRLKKITPSANIEKVEKEVWGILVEDTVYINSYPYSKLKGFNKILGKGFYSYFIGEPARSKDEQIKLGIIKPTGQQIGVCCQTGYVVVPDGTVKHLRPELLLELCKDNETVDSEIKAANLKIEEVDKMFGFLNKYNSTK